MADTPDSGADSQAQPPPPPPPPPSQEPVYPSIGTQKVTENDKPPTWTALRDTGGSSNHSES